MEFANPWFMAAGGALVSAPILIHLINRMRFKRIRWAAMEFLLKSQKRNRRKLIIEQLILLALRCLLVLLAGLLLGRLHLGGDSGLNAYHLVVIDDTPSMGDHFVDERPDKGATNSFEVAKDEVKILADTLAQTSSSQQMRVVLLSEPDDPIFNDKVDGSTSAKLDEKLKDKHPGALHVDPIKAVDKARELFNAREGTPNLPREKRVFHFVSDFRDRDWKTGPDADALAKAVDSLTATGAHVSLIDVAHARRGPNEDNTAAHPNLSIRELKPASTIVVEGAPVEFTVGVFNHSTSPKTTFLHVYTRSIFVNDKGEIDQSQKLTEDMTATGAFTHQEGGAGAAADNAKGKNDTLPPGQLTEHKFTLLFQKKQPPLVVKVTDPPEERERKRRADAEFVQIRAQIDDDPKDAGLEADNVRDVVVALVHKVPVLVVDGAPESSRKVNGDLWYLRRAIDAAADYDMDRCTVEELDRIKLDRYPDVFLVNVAEIKNKETLQKLADYVARGGSIAYFMGDKALPDFYNRLFSNDHLADNEKLFTDPRDASKEQHLFPVLLESELPPPMSPDEIANRLVNDKQPKILFPDETHPIIRGRAAGPNDAGGLVKLEDRLRYLTINRYWRCQSRSKWDPEPYQSQEVVVLPNRNSIDQYKRAAQDAMKKVEDQVVGLAREDAKFEPYEKRVAAADSAMLDALTSPYLDDLIRVLDDLVHDPGAKDDPNRPSMPELWAHPKMKALKDEIDSFRNALQYGDPLVVTRPYGRGRVLAFLTTAGTAPRGLPPLVWNDWAGSPIAGSYPVFIQQMQEYLISTSEQRTQLVGTDLALPELEASRYNATVRRFFQPQPSPWAKAPLKGGDKQPNGLKLEDLTLQPSGAAKAEVYQQVVRNIREPGVYTFEFTPKTAAGDPPAAAEVQAYAFNLDTEAESDLARASKETLLRKSTGGTGPGVGGRMALRSPGDSFDEFKDPPPEVSDMPWLFLLIFLVFAAEQALAVHLSFHLKEGEAAAGSAPRQAAA